MNLEKSRDTNENFSLLLNTSLGENLGILNIYRKWSLKRVSIINSMTRQASSGRSAYTIHKHVNSA